MKMAKDQQRNDGFIQNGSSNKLQEGWIKKGGVNNPPQTPRPAPPQAMNPKPTSSSNQSSSNNGKK